MELGNGLAAPTFDSINYLQFGIDLVDSNNVTVAKDIALTNVIDLSSGEQVWIRMSFYLPENLPNTYKGCVWERTSATSQIIFNPIMKI